MSFIFYNPNPSGKRTGDCVIRAIAKATGQGKMLFISVLKNFRICN